MQHALFVLLDGMEDDPNPALGGKKPFEVAEMPFMRSKCPHLNFTGGRGYTQLFLNEFWTGHPPRTPRAALEAAGLGMDMSPGRKAFRMSPAFIEEGTVRWAYGVDDRAQDLERAVRANMDILGRRRPEIRFFVHGRSVITMECPEEVPQGPQAPVDGPYVDILPEISEFIAAVAGDNGGLTCYPWGIGAPSDVSPCYPRIRSMVSVSNSPTALGVSATLGHGIRFVEDLEDRFPVARDLLEDGPVFLHLDEVDEYSHQKDHMKKIRVLERIDGLMEEYFSDHSNILLFVDHGTSCVTGEHILTEVPFRTDCALMGDGKRYATADVVPRFMESIQ